MVSHEQALRDDNQGLPCDAQCCICWDPTTDHVLACCKGCICNPCLTSWASTVQRTQRRHTGIWAPQPRHIDDEGLDHASIACPRCRCTNRNGPIAQAMLKKRDLDATQVEMQRARAECLVIAALLALLVATAGMIHDLAPPGGAELPTPWARQLGASSRYILTVCGCLMQATTLAALVLRGRSFKSQAARIGILASGLSVSAQVAWWTFAPSYNTLYSAESTTPTFSEFASVALVQTPVLPVVAAGIHVAITSVSFSLTRKRASMPLFSLVGGWLLVPLTGIAALGIFCGLMAFPLVVSGFLSALAQVGPACTPTNAVLASALWTFVATTSSCA